MAMRTALLLLPIVFLLSCGYRNPNVYSGPAKTIFIKEWNNRTSELGLNSDIYRSLTRWFQQSRSLSITNKREGADLILAGEIISIELPSLAFNVDNVASEVKVRLRVRYIMKDLANNLVVLQAPDELWTEEYLVSSDSNVNIDNESEALETIVDDLSKKIYQRTVAALPKISEQ
jgi:hypothetical protein